MPTPVKTSRLAQLLSGGDRRSIGGSDIAAEEILRSPSLARALLECLFHADSRVRMRAADALEKASAQNPELLRPFKPELLGLLVEERQKEVRWHLAQMVPRLQLTPAERRRAMSALRDYLQDSSSIVKTFAMQALTELAGERQ